MPVGLEALCGQTLDEVVAVLERIRRSALAYTNNQNIGISDRLRCQLEIIRVSVDTIFAAFTKASVVDAKLKEMDEMLKPIGPIRPVQALTPSLRPAKDKLTKATEFFESHRKLFNFLLAPAARDSKTPARQLPQASALPATDGTQHDIQETQTMSTDLAGSETETEFCTALEYHDGEIGALSLRTRLKLDEASRWLAPLICTQKHNDTLRLRQEGTCKWLPNTDAYNRWRSGGNLFLWLQGKGGCGKSVLIASTIEHLKNTLQDEEIMVFFYCDFQNERSTSPSEVMRSLLTQLFGHFRDRGIDPGDLPDKVLEGKSKGTLSLNDVDKLSDLVSRAASRFSRYEPIVVIDALDECADVEVLLRALLKLNQGDVRLLVASRPDQIIMDYFEGLSSLPFESVAAELAADVKLHVRAEVDSRDRFRFANPDVKEEVCAKLNEKADGRFRWVQCQLDILKRCATRPELRDALNNLPNELETTYERILGAIDERKSEGKLAQRTLAWLAVALEPLRLAQVVHWFSVDTGQGKIDRREESVGVALLQALSSLVTYHEMTDVLGFSHFSVKEYLMSRTALPMYHIVSKEAHAEVAQMCMRYISVFLKQESICSKAALLQCFPMLSYVLSVGLNHLVHVDPELMVVLGTLASLGVDVRHHPSHWERLCELREVTFGWPYPPWPSSRHDFVLYTLAAYSPSGLLESFLSNHSAPLKPRVGTNPLVYAADLRKTEHASSLLAYGADVNTHGLVIGDSHHTTPLEVAIDLGDHVIVDEMLQQGCTVTPELLATVVCMPWCSTRVLVKLMQTPTFVEWAQEIGDEKLYRGIFNSARPNTGDSRKTDEDHVAMARILCQIGIDLSVDSRFGAELVERSIHAAHISMLDFLLPPDQPAPARFLLSAATGDTSETVAVLRFLLRRGVDVTAASDGHGDTALHLAVMCPWEPRRLELIDILIKGGCNPLICNARGQTAYEISIERGYTSVVELLLYHQVTFPRDILPFALQRRSTPQIVECLIRNGANAHSTTSDGDTVLHLAITEYIESTSLFLFKVFIEAGCNPIICNYKGLTVCEVAIVRGYTSVVEHLRSCNVRFPSDTLLFALQKHSAPTMVEYLVRSGVDIHSATSHGDTVLHLAVTKYDESTSLSLIKGFIGAGCNPVTYNSMGQTALELAIEHGYTSVVEHLRSHNVQFPPDIIPFALRKHMGAQMVKCLVHNGANVHAIASNGDTILHLAVAEYDEPVCLSLLEAFIKAGCPIIRNYEGQTVWETAVIHGYTSVMDHLWSRDIKPPPDILLFALQKSSVPQMVKYLIDNGANVHAIASNGDTILHLAVAKYDEPVCLSLIEAFIEAGCNLIIRNHRNQTVCDVVVALGYTSVVDHLRSRGIQLPPDILLSALQERSTPQMVVYLIRNGANIHFTTSTGDTVLHLAITKYTESMGLSLVKTLLDAGCNPATYNSMGQTALELAIENGYTSVVEHLRSHNVQFHLDIMPLALQKHVGAQMVEYLVHNGANVHAIASNGDTILHLAVAEYTEPVCLSLVEAFIEAGCNPIVRNHRDQTVCDVAVIHGYTSVVDHLRSRGIQLPPDILLFALQERSTPQMVTYLIHNGANIHSTTSSGDTVLHLAVTEYAESACLPLVETFLEAGCDLVVRNYEGQTVCEVVIKRGYTLVVDHLLLFALKKRTVPQVVAYLICNGTSIYFDASFSCTLTIEYSEPQHLDLARALVDAGRSPRARSWCQGVFEAAMCRGHDLVVQYLLSCNNVLPRVRVIDLLSDALSGKLSTQTLQLLVDKCAAEIATMPKSLLNIIWRELSLASYPEPTRREIARIIEDARAGNLELVDVSESFSSYDIRRD